MSRSGVLGNHAGSTERNGTRPLPRRAVDGGMFWERGEARALPRPKAAVLGGVRRVGASLKINETRRRAKEAARSTTVTRWSHDSGMGEGRGKQENVVVSWLGFVNM